MADHVSRGRSIKPCCNLFRCCTAPSPSVWPRARSTNSSSSPSHALAGTLNNDALLAQGTQTAIWVTATCVRVVDACFAAGGGSALYESSPLQQRMRDLHVAAQHVGVQQRHYVNSGKLLLDSPAAKSNIVENPPAESRTKR